MIHSPHLQCGTSALAATDEERQASLARLAEVLIPAPHELTAEAIALDDPNLLRQAMPTDPIVNSTADADAALAEPLGRERDAITAGWQT